MSHIQNLPDWASGLGMEGWTRCACGDPKCEAVLRSTESDVIHITPYEGKFHVVSHSASAAFRDAAAALRFADSLADDQGGWATAPLPSGWCELLRYDILIRDVADRIIRKVEEARGSLEHRAGFNMRRSQAHQMILASGKCAASGAGENTLLGHIDDAARRMIAACDILAISDEFGLEIGGEVR